MICRTRPVHLLEDAIGVFSEVRAAADAAAYKALPIHHRERASHRCPTCVQLPGEIALVRQLRSRNEGARVDAFEERAIHERGRCPFVGQYCRERLMARLF